MEGTQNLDAILQAAKVSVFDMPLASILTHCSSRMSNTPKLSSLVESNCKVRLRFNTCAVLTFSLPLAHDFVEPQPISGPSVFFMRMIMHDWSNDYCLKILSHLRSAAAPSTQLVIIDNIASYACPDTTSAQQTPGASTRLPPAPLLANKGEANVLAYLGDIQVNECCARFWCDI